MTTKVRDENAKKKVLEALKKGPLDAGEFPMPQRRMLRILEQEGKIEYKHYAWHLREKLT